MQTGKWVCIHGYQQCNSGSMIHGTQRDCTGPLGKHAVVAGELRDQLPLAPQVEPGKLFRK